MIKQMITLDPSARPTFDSLLHTSRGTVFPECFYSFLHNYVSSLNDLPATSPFSPTAPPNPGTPSTATFKPHSTTSGFSAAPSSVAEGTNGALPSDSDHRIERIWADYESVEPYLIPETSDETVMAGDVKVDYGMSGGSSRPFQVCTSWYLLSF